MPRSTLSALSAIALAATVSAAPVLASPSDDSSSTPAAESPTEVTVDRLAGKNRYETAAEISDQWSATGKRVYIVSGHNFPDALVAASRAGVFSSPVLLTKSDHLPSETAAALERLQPKRITVIGGKGSVSDTVLSELNAYAGAEGVERLTGDNRYATSARIAAQYTKNRDRVFLASGENYPDALSAAAVAGAEHEPLLLTKPGQLPSVVADQLERLAPEQVVVVGGPQAISNTVAEEAAAHSSSGDYHRVAGENRYQTSAAVAKEFSTDLTPGYVASGLDYADALVVSALAARDEVPVILTPADRVASGTRDALDHLGPNHIFVAGGPKAVSEDVVGELSDPEAPPPPADEFMPLYVSPSPDQGSYIESFEARHEEGWATGFYTYWPGDLKWNSGWERFVEENPEGIPVVGSPKGVNPTSVHNFLDPLPQAWRDQWIMAYYQEPEDNFTTPAQREVFRERVAAMADLVRPYGVKNAVHLQEWTINPYNNQPWGGEENLAQFINAEDLDYISWSLYPAEGKSMKPGIDRIKAFSEKYAPGVPWGITAAGSPVDGSAPIGGPARDLRAQLVEEAAQYTAEVGGDAFGWFDFDEYNPGRDQLVSKDPALQEVMDDVSEIPLDN